MSREQKKILKKATGSTSQKKGLKDRYKQDTLKQKVGVKVALYIEKLTDSPEGANGTRLDQYWKKNTVNLIAHNFFDQNRLPKGLNPFDAKSIIQFFGLRGIQFGNWLSQEDRYNYMFGLAASLYDMKVILGLPYKKMGFNGKLTVSLGARGSGRASATFYPSLFAINLTRYPDGYNTKFSLDRKEVLKRKAEKYEKMLLKGGIGSFSHEWMHALDFHQGKGDFLSGGHSTRYTINKTKYFGKGLESDYEKVLAEVNTNTKTDFSKSKWREQLDQTLDGSPMGDYFKSRVEIIARSFESYLAVEMAKKGIKNIFISKPKYEAFIYPTANMLRAAKPHFDNIIKAYRNEK